MSKQDPQIAILTAQKAVQQNQLEGIKLQADYQSVQIQTQMDQIDQQIAQLLDTSKSTDKQ